MRRIRGHCADPRCLLAVGNRHFEATVRRSVTIILRHIGLVADAREARGDLSGGQQQQLAISRALIPDPKLLLLDEPTEGIQPSIVQEIAAVLQRIKEEGKRSILLVEQYLEFARAICDYFYVLDRGAVALKGQREAFRMDEVKGYLSA